MMGKKLILSVLIFIFVIIASSIFINLKNNEITGNVVLDEPIEKIDQEVLNQIDENNEETISILVKKEDYKEYSEGVVGAISKPFIEIKKHSDESNIEENINSLGGSIEIKAFDYISVDIPANKIEELAGLNSIEHVYPDRIYYEVLDNSPSMINAPLFWENGYTGKNVKIAILDTGINSSHVMLEGKVIAEKVFTGEESTNDARGHGTHVAGIAAGKNIDGYSGVAPDALLINAKVLRDEDGSGKTSEIISGIEWAVDPDNDPGTDDGADIISMSLGGTYSTPDNPYIEAINYAISKGVVVVVSSGNCGSGCPDAGCGSFRGVTMPGNVKEVITVGAVDDNKGAACFSSGENIPGVGIKPDVVAPGKDITSSVPGGYALKSGTSMASPHVSGAIALLKEKYPNYTPLQIKQALELTSTDLGEIGKDVLYGSGLLNLEQLLHFDINSVIEYDVHFKENIIKNEPFKINVTIIDDIVIDNISAKITYPDSSQKNIDLTEISDKYYLGEFFETNIEGRYDFEVTVEYNNGYISSRKSFFNVISQNLDLGFIKQVAHENQLSRGKPFNLSVIFENSANNTIDVFVEVQILYNNNIIGIYTTDHISVNPGDISIMEKDIEDNYYCDGNFDSTNICLNSVDENWDTYTSVVNSDWGGKENGCSRMNYVYENITIPDGVSNINWTLKTNLGDFSCSIPSINNNKLQLRTDLESKNTNGGCSTMCLFAFTEHYYSCPVDYWDGSTWIAATGGFSRLDSSGCTESVNNYYEGKFLFNELNSSLPGKHGFDITWPINIRAGEYDVKVIAYYGGGYDIKTSKLRVIDNNAPVAKNISFNDNLYNNDPLMVVFDLEEEGELNGTITVTNPDGSIGKSILKNAKSISGNTLTGIYENTSIIGNYRFSAEICDEVNNCILSDPYLFNISSCINDNKILLINYGEYSTFDAAIDDNYCVSKWDRDIGNTPNLDYLETFDSVIWSSGNNLKTISDGDEELLLNYVDNKGRLLIEGAEIAYNNGNNEFMKNVTHSSLLQDMLFLQSSEDNATIYLNKTRNHYITRNLNNRVLFNTTLSSYPDSIAPENGGVELISWENGGSALILFNGDARTIFVPFSIEALDEYVRLNLINDSLSWLVSNISEDVFISNINYGYLIEGETVIEAEVYSDFNTELLSNAYYDSNLIDSRHISVYTGNNTIPYNLSLSNGLHNLSLEINSDYSVKEKNYLNNYLEKELYIATKDPDVLVEDVIYEYNDNSLDLDIKLKNIGGESVTFPIEITINGNLEEEIESFIPYGEEDIISTNIDIGTGAYKLDIIANSNKSIKEYNYDNNNLSRRIYLCSKDSILVVNDNDGNNYATNNPESAKVFIDILNENGYCVSEWNEKEKGVPYKDYVNTFDVLIWSKGDYWGNSLNPSELDVINSFSKGILFEGSNIGFDENNEIMAAMGIEYSSDILLEGNINLVLKDHDILHGIESISINKEASPYADSVNIIDGNDIALWDENKAAIVSYDNGNRKVYFAFSVDSVNDDSREKLVVNSVEWIKRRGSLLRTFSDGSNERTIILGNDYIEKIKLSKSNYIEHASLTAESGEAAKVYNTVNSFEGNLTSNLLGYNEPSNKTVYINIPRNAIVTSAKYDVVLGGYNNRESDIISSSNVSTQSTIIKKELSRGSSIISEQEWVGTKTEGYCSLPGYTSCYEFENAGGPDDGDAFVRAKSRIAYKEVSSINYGDLGGFNGYYAIGPIKFDYYCDDVYRNDQIFYYAFGQNFGDNVANPVYCDYYGCSAGSLSNIGTFTVANVGNYFDRTSFACWVYDEDYSSDGSWAKVFVTAAFNNIQYSERVYSLQCYSDSDCGSGRKCYKTGSWNQWYCGNTPDCNSNSDCGTDGWENLPECLNDNVYQNYVSYTCNNPGAESAYCSHSTQYSKKQECLSGEYCSQGACYAAACNKNSDCGTDGYVNGNYCSNDDVYSDYRINICNNPGTSSAECSSVDTSNLIDECTSSEVCENGACQNVECFVDSECGLNDYVNSNYCINNSVYRNFRDHGCNNPGTSSASCSYDDIPEPIINCNEDQYCFNGECKIASCTQNSECGTDGIVESKFCHNGDVYQKYRSFSCLDPRSDASICSYGDSLQIVNDCEYACFNGECVDGVYNPAVYIGDSRIWNYNGYFAGPETISRFSDYINSELLNCNSEICSIPVKIESGSIGNLELSNLEIMYYLNHGASNNALNPSISIDDKIIWSYNGEFDNNSTITFKDEINSYLSGCQSSLDGYCSVPLVIKGQSGVLKISKLEVEASNLVDIDHDGVPDSADNDIDNDGIDDSIDNIVGTAKNIKTNIDNLDITIPDITASQTNDIKITQNNTPLIEFKANNRIDFNNITIKKQDDSSDRGSLIVSGLNLEEGETKTIYIDKLLQDSIGVCVKDAEITSIEEISDNCDGTYEYYITCNGVGINGYYCETANGKYKISGLKHSGVEESNIVIDNDLDGYTHIEDCDDNNISINPSIIELCDNIDNNCNELIDEGLIGVEICSEWSSIDYKGEACGTRSCDNCGSSWNENKICTQQCIPQESCSWSDTGYNGEECGNLNCNDGCEQSYVKETKQCSICTPSTSCISWSNSDCGTRTCSNGCGSSWSEDRYCISQCVPSEVCSWSGAGYFGESCGELRCSDGCGYNYIKETKDCSTRPFEPTCGDNQCNGGETCSTCSQDCGRCKPSLSRWCDINCYASDIPASQSHPYCGEGWDEWDNLYCRIALPEGERCGTCYTPFKDTDNDRIEDIKDKCPETTEGDNVDEEGCSCNQLKCDDRNIRTKNICDPNTITCQFTLHGDLDESGCIDDQDFSILYENFGTDYSKADFDESGKVDFKDLFIFSDNHGLCIT